MINFPYGVKHEAEIYCTAANNGLSIDNSVPSIVYNYGVEFRNMGLDAWPLNEVIDIFIDWTQDKLDACGESVEDETSVTWYLALLVKSYVEINDALPFDILFKRCFIAFYERVGYEQKPIVTQQDNIDYLKETLQQHAAYLPDEHAGQMVSLINHMEVDQTLKNMKDSGMLNLLEDIQSKIEDTYTQSLPLDLKTKVCNRIDELVYSVARYNVEVSIEDYLKVVFWLYHISPEFDCLMGFKIEEEDIKHSEDHWDGFLNEMIWYIDSKRRYGSLGDGWFREVRDMVTEHSSYEVALREQPSCKYYLRLDECCGKLKEAELTREFLLNIFDAYLRNESEYDIENSYAERCILRRDLKAKVESEGGKFKLKGEYFSPLLVYDGYKHTIREDRTYLASRGIAAIRGIGSISEYFSCIADAFPPEILDFDAILADLHIGYDMDEEFEMPMTPSVLLSIEESICRCWDVSPDDKRFVDAREELARRWIEFKVNVDAFEKVPRRLQDRQPLFRLQ